MFSNISPYLCSNMHEFDDERAYLKEKTFPRIKEYYEKLNISFDPIQIEWKEDDDIVKSGSLLRLLIHNIIKSSPFFICLMGKKYGTYLERKELKTPSISSARSSEREHDMNWIEKNLIVASQTGFDQIVNSKTFNNSFTDIQINTAINDENSFSFIRFYFRQIEFLDEKYSHLSIEDRKLAIASYEAENDYCEFKVKDLKLKIAKKGLIVKYYKSLVELDELIYNDYIDILNALINTNLINLNKTKFETRLENNILNKLNNYLITESIKELYRNLDTFLKRKQSNNVHFKLDSTSSNYSITDSNCDMNSRTECDGSENEQINNNNDEYLEILKLRHINLSKYINSTIGQNNNINDQKALSSKSIFLITGTRGKGKSCFMSLVYQQLCLFKSIKFDTLLFSESTTNTIASPMPSKVRPAQIESFYLFYFIKPGDYFISILIDIIIKMRIKYLNKNCTSSLNNELYDTKSIIEQFHASLNLGPVVIFIDGIGEMDTNHAIKISDWLPSKLENCKFVFTLNKSSEYFTDLVNTKSCIIHELNVFSNQTDYKMMFAKFLTNKSSNPAEINSEKNLLTKNRLYGKFLSIFNELKSSNHYANPLFIQMIAQEIFTFDKEIYKIHHVNIETTQYGIPMENESHLKEGHMITSNEWSLNENNKKEIYPVTEPSNFNSVNIINSYIEEVSTLRQIMEKIIKRYIKKNNWSLDNSIPLSIDNAGWVGDVLCLIAVSVHGINKDSIMRILALKGYIQDLKINDIDWRIFRMQFGEFIIEGPNGRLAFCHLHFKEAVQSLLLDGFSVMIDFKSEQSNKSSKKNISAKQKEIHSYIILDLLENQIKKSEFDLSSQLNNNKADNSSLSQKYVELLHELVVHLYMIYDLVNLCKLVTSFKTIQIFYDNRMSFLNEWLDFCGLMKVTINLETLRPILLSSFTIGIPQYVIEQKDDLIFFRNVIIKKQNGKILPQTNEETKKLRFSKIDLNVISKQEENLRIFKSPLKSSRLLTKSFNSQSNHSVSSFLSDNRTNFEMADSYEHLIDILIDLNGVSDLSKSKYGDNHNILLINRTLILIDLMKNIDDKLFLEKYAYMLGHIVNNLIVQNYPLNDMEKLKYSSLLQLLANLSNQMYLFDYSLKYLIKAVEMLEDLYISFSTSELNAKYKTRNKLYQISYRLSYLYSNMALILFKLNELNNVDLLLSKAKEYYNKKYNFKEEDMDIFDYQSSTNSLFKFDTESFTDLLNKKNYLNNPIQTYKTNSDNDHEDGGIYESKYYYYLVSSLFEVQKTNFKKANQLFQSALNLSIKWFGQNHSNTSKIYHYYGCFFSLKDMTYFNPQKSELYLRKALYIREKCKIENPLENLEKHKLLESTKPNLFESNSNISNLSSNESSYVNMVIEESLILSSEIMDLKSNPACEKLILFEEKNAIAEILYDLGCLLATNESVLSKKEAIDLLRRSLDIKVLIFGEKYWDCEVIKKRLNEVVSENSQYLNKPGGMIRENGLNNYSPLNRKCISSNNYLTSNQNNINTYRSTSSLKINGEISPEKTIELIKKQIKKDTANTLFDKWLEKNSIIEKIPSKLLDKSKNNLKQSSSQLGLNEPQPNSTNDKEKFEQEKSSYLENEFLHSSIYVDHNNNHAQIVSNQEDDHEKNNAKTTLTILPTKNLNKSKTQYKENINEMQTKVISNLKLQRSRSSVGNKINDSHKRVCDCPTALSIDIHNSRSVSGPNSDLRTLINIEKKNDKDNGLKNKNDDVKNKILKHIYYKSAWYDLPKGTNKLRFKSFIKLKPNA